MSLSPAEDPRAVRRTALRRAVLTLVLGVVALDAVALAVYFLGGIGHAPVRTQRIFTGVWLVSTVLVVAVLLKRVRTIRYTR